MVGVGLLGFWVFVLCPFLGGVCLVPWLLGFCFWLFLFWCFVLCLGWVGLGFYFAGCLSVADSVCVSALLGFWLLFLWVFSLFFVWVCFLVGVVLVFQVGCWVG